MSRILIFGFAPLAIENLRVTGPSLRTWHFTQVLLEAQHEVHLIANRWHGIYPPDLPSIISQRKDHLTYDNVSNEVWNTPSALSHLLQDRIYDCAIGVTAPATAILVDYAGQLPLWADLYGSIIAEAQVLAFTHDEDAHIPKFLAMEQKIVTRSDIFSCVSERQQWSTIGELGAWGRLNRWTIGYDFATTIPIACETSPYQTARRFIRGGLCPEDAFIILYTGGYNTWTDIDTLFAALEETMERYPHVVFISTGGKIEGHDEITYQRFQEQIEKSPHRMRYYLRGWVPKEEMAYYYLESNVAINVDRKCYEAMLGSRTRVLDWLRAELPCILSSLTELAGELVSEGGGMAYESENAASLAGCLVECIENAPAAAEMGRRGRQVLLERFTFTATADRVLSWVNNPNHAPDYGRIVSQPIDNAPPFKKAFQTPPEVAQLISQANTFKWLAMGFLTRSVKAFSSLSIYHVTYLDCEIPPRMEAGKTYEVTVNIRNDSTATWYTSQQVYYRGINLSYHWKTYSNKTIFKEGARTPLPFAIRARETAILKMQIGAPNQPGHFRLELDLVHEGVTWFSEAGASPASFEVEVTA